MKKQPKYELVYSTKNGKEPTLIERMALAMHDVDMAHLRLRNASKHLKQLKP